ncbi:MAG: tetratricopeptide repeat protein [Candidatus Omnitrophota bacterium]
MKKILIFFIFTFFASTVPLFAQSAEELYRKAGLNYENEDYKNAISLYEMLLKMDRVSPEVYYNLGNSYFKIKKTGKAIVNYKRALRLDPGGRDIQHNLKLARASAVDKIEQPEKGFLIKVILLPYDRMNINQLTVIVSSVYLSIIAFLIFSIFFITKRRVLFYAAGASAAALITFLIFLVLKIHTENYTRYAVVTSEKIDVRSGPKEDYLLQFTLHEGAEIRVVKEGQGWYEIDLSKDLRGWLPSDTVEII